MKHISHVKKTKKTSVRKIDGECLTENTIIDKTQLLKKRASKRKLNFDSENGNTDGELENSEEIILSNKQKKTSNRCKKCKKNFLIDMLACKTCNTWQCKATCLPKIYKVVTDVFLVKSVKKCLKDMKKTIQFNSAYLSFFTKKFSLISLILVL